MERRGRLPTRVGACLLAAVVLLSGCASDAEQAVGETGERLAELRSGELALRMSVRSLHDEASTVGFELTGPFALRERGLPHARLTYTQFVADTEQTSTLIATGEEAFIEVGGQAYRLPDEQAADLAVGDGDGFQSLALQQWLVDPEIVERDGDVEVIHADVEPATALRDLLALGHGLGADDAALPPLNDDEAERLRRAVRVASAELVTGAEDRLLRRLVLHLELATDADLPEPYRGGVIDVDLRVDGPNSPVEVQPPADPLPAEELG